MLLFKTVGANNYLPLQLDSLVCTGRKEKKSSDVSQASDDLKIRMYYIE
jgi:hypothetical protein